MKKTYITDADANLTTIRDPMFTVVGDTYYLTGSQPPYWKGENAGVHLWSTKDLKHFAYHGIIVKRDDIPEDMWCHDRFWAPELFYNGGKFYVTFNCRNESEAYHHDFGVGLAVSDRAEGPYTIITTNAPLCSGIDGTIFKDDDGKLYVGANGSHPENNKSSLFLHELDVETGNTCNPQVVCTVGNDGEWDSVGVEGQCVVKRCGRYFQWYSSWSQGFYASGLLTADSINGPWVKSELNPIIKATDEYVECGHNHCFRGLDGKDYVVFHAFCNYDSKDDRKERLYIREIEYHSDGSVTLK